LSASTVLALGNRMGGLVGNTFPLVSLEVSNSSTGNSRGSGATIDHTDMRGSEPQGHDPSGADSD